MPQGNATYPGELHGSPEDKWLADNAADKNAVFFCQYPDGNPEHDSTSTGRAMQPRGILIQGDSSAAGNAGVVRGYLWAENSIMTDDYYLQPGVVHPLRFKVIYARGTTARGIKIIG